MKIVMNVVDAKELDKYIDNNTVPFAVCPPESGVTSERQAKYLEKYYDKVVDRRGWPCYYCNIINAHKCREVGYQNISFEDGSLETIDGYQLKKHPSINKYVVITRFKSGKEMSSVDLSKIIRLKVEEIKSYVNEMNNAR